jgi:hypothetical protein
MSTKTRTELTVQDLHDALERPDHFGWGYASSSVSDRCRDRIDRYVVKRANAQGWTPEQLFDWSNSKHGRWLWDSILTSERNTSMTLAQITETLDRWNCFSIPR